MSLLRLREVRLPTHELWRYFFVSALALAADVGVLLITARFVHHLWAASLGFLVGAVASYVLATRWAFSHRRLGARPGAEFAAYALIGIVGLGLNILVIYSAVDVFGLPLLLGKAFAASATFAFNFSARKFALFKK